MEELQPHDIEDLLQELRQEDSAGEVPAPEVETKARVCLKCGKHNLENAWHCIDCGTTLSAKTLMDVESSQPSGLSSISPYFEQDVAETLKTVIQDDESVIWGCNISFGYLLVTSQRLIGVWFTPEVRRSEAKKDGFGVLLDLVVSLAALLAALFAEGEVPVTGVFGGASRDAARAAPAVDSPSRPLTQKELASRRMSIYDLEKLISADLVPRWRGETHPTKLTARFREDKESTFAFLAPARDEVTTFAFCAPHEAREAHKLIAAWLG